MKCMHGVRLKDYCEKCYTGSDQKPSNSTLSAGLCCKTMLQECRDAIASLPIDALGEGNNNEGMTWPIRDELIDKISKCLNAI